jgi:hypothetical protein
MTDTLFVNGRTVRNYIGNVQRRVAAELFGSARTALRAVLSGG